MRGRVEVLRDPACALVAAEVDIVTADGATHRLRQRASRGSDENPMSDADLEEKLRTAAAAWEPGCDMEPLIDAIWGLDRNEDAASVLRLTLPPAR